MGISSAQLGEAPKLIDFDGDSVMIWTFQHLDGQSVLQFHVQRENEGTLLRSRASAVGARTALQCHATATSIQQHRSSTANLSRNTCSTIRKRHLLL